MRKLLPIVALLPALLAAPAYAADARANTNPSEVVARAGGTDLTADELRAYLDSLASADRAAIAADPAKLSQLARVYLAQRMLLKEAQDKKFEQKPEIKAQLDRVKDAALAELYLASVVKVPDGFPSDADVQSAYDANKSAFVVPRQYRLAQVFVRGVPDDKDAKAKLEAVQKALKDKGADFGRVAAQFSDIRPEAEKGGEIGWVAETQLVPDIKNAVAGLAKDAISEPVRMDDGWHILKLLDTKPAGTAPLADVKPALVERLRQARAQQMRQAYLGQLLQKDPPAINELALSKITPKKGRNIPCKIPRPCTAFLPPP